jgi:outer membrane protein assembly factor BamB
MKLTALMSGALALSAAVAVAVAGDWPQFGGTPARNMVSDEKGLPLEVNPGTVDETTGKLDTKDAKGLKWVARLGTFAFGNPTVAGGRVFVGTNNEMPRDPKIKGDYSCLYCLDEKTGELQWQFACPKLAGGANIDYGGIGLCSSPTVDAAAGRVYVVTNRCEVLCLDVNGQANGNDGPFKGEGQYVAGPGKPAFDVSPKDADIVWRYDMREELGIFAHFQCASAVLLVGERLYVTTSNSRDWTGHIPAPNAPVLICLDKQTGKLLGQEASGVSKRTFDSNWSSPAYGKVGGQEMVIFGGGDGWCYGFAADPVPGPNGTPILKELWRFDCNPPSRRMKGNKPARHEDSKGPSEIVATPVFHDGKVYVATGQSPENGDGEACISCIDASKTGDVTATGKVWQSDKVGRSTSTCAVANGLCFVGDGGGYLYCFDANTGQQYWKHDVESQIESSPLIVGDRVYVGTKAGLLLVVAAAKEYKQLASSSFDGALGTPVPANGTLYVASEKYLYALSEKK